MLTNEQISAALSNPQIEEGKIIKGTTVNLMLTLKTAGCNKFRFFKHPQGGWFFYGFTIPEGTKKEDITDQKFKPTFESLVSKNFDPTVDKVTATTQIGLMKTKDRETGVVEAKPCIVKATSKLVPQDEVYDVI